jgi:hypothetical protein
LTLFDSGNKKHKANEIGFDKKIITFVFSGINSATAKISLKAAHKNSKMYCRTRG